MCTYFRGMHWHYLSLNRQCPFLSWWNLSTFSRHWRGPGTFPVALVYRRSGLVVHFGMPKSIERLGSLEFPGETWRNGSEKSCLSYFVKEGVSQTLQCIWSNQFNLHSPGLTSNLWHFEDLDWQLDGRRIWSFSCFIWYKDSWNNLRIRPPQYHINCNTFYWYILHYSLCIHIWCVFIYPKFNWESASSSPMMFRFATS